MAVTWMILVALSAAQAKPANKTCPDGAVILASDNCAVFPDHRYLNSHAPHREVVATEWWCRGASKPSEVRIDVTHSDRAKEPTEVIALEKLRLYGRQASRSSVLTIQRELAKLTYLGSVSGRCQLMPDRSIQPVLSIHGWDRAGKEVRARDLPLK